VTWFSRKHSERRDKIDRWLFVFSICAFVVGIALRYQFICVTNRPSDPENLLGDATWYMHETVNAFEPGFVPTLYDTLFPPGAPMYFYVLRQIDPSMALIDTVQWVLSCLVPIMLGLTAKRLFGRRSAIFVFGFSSLYFPLWEFFGYFISEGPFIFTLTAAFLFLLVSLQAPSTKAALWWGLLSGLFLGFSAACKSCALLSALLIFAALLHTRRKNRFRLWPTAVTVALGLFVVLLPISIRATRLNEGRFLLLANDAPRTFLLGHQGRVGLMWWFDSKRDFHMNFSNPSASQHMYSEVKTYPWGVYETAPNYSAGWQWIKENPGDALLLSLEHVFDMFAIALPWPGYFRSYVRWTIFFNEIFLVLLLLPVMIHLVRSRRAIWWANRRYAGDAIVIAAVLSIYILAFLFVGEGRYRICYDGFMIMLASRVFFPGSFDEVGFAFESATAPRTGVSR